MIYLSDVDDLDRYLSDVTKCTKHHPRHNRPRQERANKKTTMAKHVRGIKDRGSFASEQQQGAKPAPRSQQQETTTPRRGCATQRWTRQHEIKPCWKRTEGASTTNRAQRMPKTHTQTDRHNPPVCKVRQNAREIASVMFAGFTFSTSQKKIITGIACVNCWVHLSERA